MKIAYNPITAAALTTAPANNDITFDLKGLNIFVRGVKFKGTDTTYSVFKKHTSSSGGGYNGLVPVPSYTSTNTRFLREDGTWQVPSNQYTYSKLNGINLDTLKTEGKWYYISGGSTNTNGPEGFNNGSELYVGRNASGYRYQKVITADEIIWFRTWDNSSWSNWKRWYTDANTDSKVLQSNTTTDNFRPIILGYNNKADHSDISTSVTNQVYTTTKIYAQPSTGYLWATKLYSGGKEVLTSHQSLSDYVTISTKQTITGQKTFTSQINSSLSTGTYLDGNKGNTIINSTAGAGRYVMLFKGNSTNGYFTHGVYQGKYLLQYTTKTTVNKGTNAVTKSVTLLDESGDSSFPGTLSSINLELSGNIYFTTTSQLHWNTGTYQQRITVTDDSSSKTSVFNFQQSTNSGSSWSTLASIYDNGYVYANGFRKNGSSNQKVLLGDGSDKNLSDFSMAHSHPYLQLQTISGTTDVNTLKGTRLYYTTSDGGSQNLVNSPFTNTFSMIQVANIINGDTDWRRSIIAFNPQGDMKIFNDRGTPGDGGVWYTVLTSGNYSSIADSRYVTSLGTSGNYLTWTKNGTTNKITIPYATSASKWTTARTITLGSYLSGSVSLNGSANVTLNASVIGLTTQGKKTAISGTTVPSNGVRLYEVYMNGYPTTFGNLLSIKGGGSAELLLAWKNTQRIYVRSKSDISTEEWTAWKTVAFTDDNVASATTVKVTQHTTNNTNYPIVWSNQNNTNTSNSQLYKSWQHLYYNPSTKRLTATGGFIKGGSSDSYILLGGGGHKALSDLQSDYDSRYVNITGDTMTGPLVVKASITGTQLISNIANGTAPLKVTSKTVVTNLNSDLLDGYHETSFFRTRGSQTIASSIPTTTELSSNNNLSGNWNVTFPGASGHLVQFNTGSGSTRYMQFYSYYSGSLYWRNSTDSTLSTKSWKTIVDSANYTGIVLKIGTATKGSATLPIYLNAGTPTACSTTLGVSITGNAATATKLQTARTINGTSFNGSANITTAYWGATRTITLSGAVTGSASVNGSKNVTITTTYQTGSIDGRYVGGKKTAGHGSQGTAYTADTYSSNFVNKAFVAYAERGSWAYANNGYITTNIGVNIPLAGTAVFQWGASDTNKTQLFITPHNYSGVSNPATNEMLFYTSNGSGYTSAWTRVLTHRNYTTYTVTKTGGGASGTWGISITGNAATATTAQYLASNSRMDYGWNGLNYFNINGTAGTAVKANNTPTTAWWHILRFNHANSSGYYTDLAVPFNANSLYYKRVAAGALINGKWVRILDELNYTAYVNPANFVTSLGTNGNYVTWVKNGATNRITVPYATNADKIDGFHANTSQNPFGKIPTITGSGVMEVGRYIDFHYNSSDTSDYRTRLQINHSGGSYTVLLPTKSGTLAMTSDIPTVTNYYWANVKVSTQSSTSTFPTFGNITVNSQTTLKGNTYMQGVSYLKNSSQYPYIHFMPSFGNSILGTIYYNAGSSSSYTASRFFFRQYSYSNGSRLNYYEDYNFPNTNSGRTSNTSYYVLTTKNTSVSGGGSSWGSSITVTINGTSKTLTIPYNPNTDTKVTNTLKNNIQFYITGTSSSSTNTGTQYFDSGVYVTSTSGQLSTNTIISRSYAYVGNHLYLRNGQSGTYADLQVNRAGTTSTTGITYLLLGNSTSSGSTNNAYGILRLYGTSSGYTNIICGTNNTTGYTLYLPGATGQLVYHSNDTAVGSSTKGVYISSGGAATAMSYSLNATVNSGSAGKLAYYSNSTTIEDYYSSVGSSITPVYISYGSIVAGKTITDYYWANVKLSSDSSITTKPIFGEVTVNDLLTTGSFRVNVIYISGSSYNVKNDDCFLYITRNSTFSTTIQFPASGKGRILFVKNQYGAEVQLRGRFRYCRGDTGTNFTFTDKHSRFFIYDGTSYWAEFFCSID